MKTKTYSSVKRIEPEKNMIELTGKAPEKVRVDLLVYLVSVSKKNQPVFQHDAIKKAMKEPLQKGDFSGKTSELFLFYPAAGLSHLVSCKASRVLVVGMGELKEDDNGLREQLRVVAGTAVGHARKLKTNSVLTVLPDSTGLVPADVAECVSEGLILGNYLFAKYKKSASENEQPAQVQRFTLHDGGMSHRAVRRGMTRGKVAALAACTARDMANEPGNTWTPAHFAKFGRKLARQSNLKCTVLEKTAMKKLGMGGIVGVNQGSDLPPELVILEYRTNKKKPTLMLVGKGLTFDSGGISLKPAAGMQNMKYDMCGGAAVLSAMQAVAEGRPKHLNIVALIPATDNMSGSAAIKPGDVITHYNGKTSEVVNTDAEGRLILADALAYGIEKFKPDAVIDLATLTGAVIVGLGHHRTGLLSNDDGLVEQITSAGDKCGEPLWRLPLGEEYSKQLKSEVADLKNVGGRSAGTITAAAYLQEFVGDTPWAHLDIAGTAWRFTEKSYIPAKGPSGIGTRTLLGVIRNWKPLKK